MKICSKCLEEKVFDLFSPNKRTKDGYHSICKPCAAKIAREWQQDNKEKQRETQRRRNIKKHGITSEQYDVIFNQQLGLCAICEGKPDGSGTIHGVLNIDHDHLCCPGDYSCGNCIRGLLCNKCNTALGLLKDSISTMYKVIEYLDINGTRPDR